LSNYVKNRRGQVICCENDRSEWLDFKKIADCQGCKSNHIEKERQSECFYYKHG